MFDITILWSLEITLDYDSVSKTTISNNLAIYKTETSLP